MPLYCYIIETGMYEDREANILGHTNKYSQEGFNKLCIEITEKHGDVEEIEYFAPYDKTDVTEIRYKINASKLIEHLIKDYGFIELDIPINDGVQHVEVSRTPVPPENLRKVVVKRQSCPIGDDNSINTEFLGMPHLNPCSEKSFFIKKDDVKHPNARRVVPEMEITCSSPDSDFDTLLKELDDDNSTGVEAAKKIAEYTLKRLHYGTYPSKHLIEKKLKRGSLNCSDFPTDDMIKYQRELIEKLKKEEKDQ